MLLGVNLAPFKLVIFIVKEPWMLMFHSRPRMSNDNPCSGYGVVVSVYSKTSATPMNLFLQ
jgi:hypothetical protein